MKYCYYYLKADHGVLASGMFHLKIMVVGPSLSPQRQQDIIICLICTSLNSGSIVQ